MGASGLELCTMFDPTAEAFHAAGKLLQCVSCQLASVPMGMGGASPKSGIWGG